MFKFYIFFLVYASCYIFRQAMLDANVGTLVQLEEEFDFIRITQSPRLLQAEIQVHFMFLCIQPSIINIQLLVSTDFENDVIINYEKVNCILANTTYKEVVKLKVPRYISYRPSYYNQYSVIVLSSQLNIWLQPRLQHIDFRFSQVREALKIKVLPPFERPVRPLNICIDWLIMLIRKSIRYSPICKQDNEKIDILSIPLALTGSFVGLIKKFPSHTSSVLEKERIKNLNQPRFTFVMMIYMIEYCDRKYKYCSLMHHYAWNDNILSPLVLITHSGHLHLELFLLDGHAKAYLSSDEMVIPKNQWVQVIITCYNSYKWDLHLRTDLNTFHTTNIVLFRRDIVHYDDTEGVFAFGGSDVRPSFKGFISNIFYYRNKALGPEKIKFELSSRLLDITHDTNCKTEAQQIASYSKITRNAIKYINMKRSCESIFHQFVNWQFAKSTKQCFLIQDLDFIKTTVRKEIMSKNIIDSKFVSTKFFEQALALLENEGHSRIKDIALMLKHASCLQNDDATYILAIFFNHGIASPCNHLIAYNKLLKCAIQKNKFCLMSLAYKHSFGLDEVPMDLDIAYSYYMDVVYTTKRDIDEHRNEDVYTELIRLNDEKTLEKQTDEDDNLFLWLKYQASQGIVSAQHNLAQMLYWGSRGVKRNISTASNYYKAAAESKNPTALYDYAIILLKGHGVERDEAKGMELLEEAAQHNHAHAINTIGWYALVYQRDMPKAVEYLERSFQLGNADAGHNLAYMLMTGKYPGLGVDKVKAWRYISRAATRGNYDSGILVAVYNMKGHPSISRSPNTAMEWGRFMSEQNPSIGKLLMKGIKNFRSKNWYASLIYYLMAAESGVEVANFNVAYLCDENYDYLSSIMLLDCVWRHYNQSIQRTTKRENPYGWMRMADLQYDRNDIRSASMTYCETALSGNPQGLFNLALAVQSNHPVPDVVWQKLKIPFNVSRNTEHLLIELYSRCLKSLTDDSYLPCLLSLISVKIKFFFFKYFVPICVLSFFTFLAIFYFIFRSKFSRFNTRQHDHEF